MEDELDPKEGENEDDFKAGSSLNDDDIVDDDEPVDEELDADPLLHKKGKKLPGEDDDAIEDDSLDELADAEFDEEDEPYDDVDHW